MGQKARRSAAAGLFRVSLGLSLVVRDYQLSSLPHRVLHMNYGFKAIEHRYSVLGGKPYKNPDTKKIDLARQLINCYGVGFTDCLFKVFFISVETLGGFS